MKRILIVDDNLVAVRALTMKLQASGYEVMTAEDGAGAVSTVRTQQPDLVLLDISFPPDVAHGGGVPWDGFLIMSWLNRMEEARGIPIIILTGSNSPEHEQRAYRLGAVGYFHKDVDLDQLVAGIREVLGETVEASPAQT